MILTVKDMDIATGDIQVVILNEKDAHDLDLHPMDRVMVHNSRHKTLAILDIAESGKAVSPGHIGCFEEVLDALNVKHGDKVTIELADKPASTAYIKKKLDGHELNQNELNVIVQDIVDNKLTDVELTTFVLAGYTRGLTMSEVESLTRAMVTTGETLTLKTKPVVDLHSIGGVPGNRITMLMVPMLVAAGCKVPKTSSRAITSPAGTADTMEIFCPVSHPLHKLKKILDEAGGFIVWGGAVNLAPADDKIIRIEHPLSIDAEGQMLASIMSKKASVGATHLLMEIPIGEGTKVHTRKHAKKLAKKFFQLGELLGIKIKTVITDGSQPVGNGIGPVLEARDVIYALKNDPRAPKDLVHKSIMLTGELLEFVNKAKKGQGKALAKKILKTGKAYEAMEKIVNAQGGKMPNADKLIPAKFTFTLHAEKTGTIATIHNSTISKAARLAGSPTDIDAGIWLHTRAGQKIQKGQPILTVYSNTAHKLGNAKKITKRGIIIK